MDDEWEYHKLDWHYKPVKNLPSPHLVFLAVATTIVLAVTLIGYMLSSKQGAIWGLFVGLMIGVPVGVAAGFWQTLKNAKTIARMKKKE